MKNSKQNPPAAPVNVEGSPTKRFNIFTFGVSMVILLSVSPYWLGIKENSALIIIRQRLDLNIGISSVPMFFLHLFTTMIAFFIYFKSGASKSFADRISYTDYVIELFGGDHKQTVKNTQLIIKIFVLLIVIISSYLAVISLLKGTELPISECNFIFLSLIFGHLIWNIEEKEDNNYKRKSKFSIEKFKKKLSNFSVINTIDGEIEGELIVNPDGFTDKASYMRFKSKNPKITVLIDEASLRTYVDNALSRCNIYQDIEQRRNFLADFKLNSSKEIHSQQISEEVTLIREKTSSILLTEKINLTLQEEIESKIGKHPFRIKFNITKDTIKESLGKEIDKVLIELKNRTKDEEAYQEKLRLERVAKEQWLRVQTEERRKSLLNTLDKLATDAHTSIDQRKYFLLRVKIDTLEKITDQTFLEISNELSDNSHRQANNNPHEHKSERKDRFYTENYEDTAVTVLDEAFTTPAKNISEILFEHRDGNIDDNTKEKLSVSTSIFEDYDIDINSFLNILNEKWLNEQGERNKNAYEQLIEDTLFQLSNINKQ